MTDTTTPPSRRLKARQLDALQLAQRSIVLEALMAIDEMVMEHGLRTENTDKLRPVADQPHDIARAMKASSALWSQLGAGLLGTQGGAL